MLVLQIISTIIIGIYMLIALVASIDEVEDYKLYITMALVLVLPLITIWL